MQHLGPVLRFGAAGARVDRDDGVLSIEVAREHRPNLAALDVAVVGVERLLEIRRHVFALFRPVEQHREVVGLLS